ncbi:MAG: hypothetical protein AMJ88_11345 [Anaerolineae bacterium SM23_ 63]|nr:MAG: hypothetical protein AMJ88_11345 [Anaerolineae bacterium SM23_ 63]
MTFTYLPTGITGLDDMLDHKGIPSGHTVLLSGGPGSGKTTMAIQFLFQGATQYDEPGLYISLEDEIRLMFINVSPVRSGGSERPGLMQLGMKEFKLVKLLEAIREGIQEVKAKRVVIDPITMFMLQYPDEEERIHALRDLIAELRMTSCTHLLVSELRGTGVDREYQFEEYLSQGVILLRTHQKGEKLVRIAQVEKMRGVNIDPQPRPYDITAEGIVIFPELPVFR